MLRQPPRPPLFPYTTLFRSLAAPGVLQRDLNLHEDAGRAPEDEGERSELQPARVALHVAERFGIFMQVEIARSEEHTSELQSHSDLVCRLLLEKKKITNKYV